MVLIRTDPFRDVDRLFSLLGERSTRPFSVPMDAYRKDDRFILELDLPGIAPEATELSVEGNTLTITATRPPRDRADGEPVITERQYGTFSRQVLLGDNLDTEHVEASYDAGVLRITIPVAEHAKPRRIEIRTPEPSPELATVT